MKRNIYSVLRFMSKSGRYPKGFPIDDLRKRFDRDIMDELLYYNYIEKVEGNARITVRGREALQTNVLATANLCAAIVAAIIAIVALFLK